MTAPNRPSRHHLACLIALACILGIGSNAEAQFRVVNYNIANTNGDLTALQHVFEELALDDTPGAATAPHLYVFQEVRESDLEDLETVLEQAHPGIAYTLGTFTATMTENGSVGAQALFYRSSDVVEITPGHDDVFTGAGRNTDRWQLRLSGYEFDLFVYSAHLKAGQSSSFEDERADGAEAIRANAAGLSADAHVIYVGDFNFYDSGEPGYEVLTQPGPKQGVDPLGSANWTGSSNASKHTQSPRATSGGGLVGGGLDDRFDQHLVTAGLLDGSGFSVVDYRAFGNDGNHYNTSINDGPNSYYPSQIGRSNALADALFDASDHIPVVVDYRYPGRVTGFMDDEIGLVIEGATYFVDVLLSNIAPGEFVDSSSVFVESLSGFFGEDLVDDLSRFPAFDTINVRLDTTTVGDVSGSVLVSGTGQDMNAPFTLNANATVIGHARPSFSPSSELISTVVEYDIEPGDTPLEITVPVHNFGYSGLQARCRIASVAGADGSLSVDSVPAGLIAQSPEELQLILDPGSLEPGSVTDLPLGILVAEEDLPGATVISMFLTIRVNVGNAPSASPDLNGDSLVNGADLAILIGSWGGSENDLDGDGSVSGGDLAILLASWTVP